MTFTPGVPSSGERRAVWTEWERCNESDNLSETLLYRDFVLAELWKMGAG